MNNSFFKAVRQRLIGRLAAIKANPHQIASAYALGFFLGTTPLVGFKVWIALLLSTIFRWSRPAAVIGVYHINSLTGPVFYTIAFFIGKLLLGTQVKFVFPEKITPLAIFNAFMGNGEIFLTLMAGGLLLGIPASLLLYQSSYRIIKNLQNQAYATLS